jgi:hypothetical protein
VPALSTFHRPPAPLTHWLSSALASFVKTHRLPLVGLVLPKGIGLPFNSLGSSRQTASPLSSTRCFVLPRGTLGSKPPRDQFHVNGHRRHSRGRGDSCCCVLAAGWSNLFQTPLEPCFVESSDSKFSPRQGALFVSVEHRQAARRVRQDQRKLSCTLRSSRDRTRHRKLTTGGACSRVCSWRRCEAPSDRLPV